MFGVDFFETIKPKPHQEALSVAALHAVVAAVGGSFLASEHTSDEMGIDVHCTFQGCFSVMRSAYRRLKIDFQLKSTRRPKFVDEKECWSCPIEAEQLKKYVEPSTVPLILVLFILPEGVDLERCVEADHEKTALKKCLYWTTLEGFPLDYTQKTQTVHFPKKNILTPEALALNIVAPLAERKGLRYEKQE